jgi:hypothetical protein
MVSEASHASHPSLDLGRVAATWYRWRPSTPSSRRETTWAIRRRVQYTRILHMPYTMYHTRIIYPGLRPLRTSQRRTKRDAQGAGDRPGQGYGYGRPWPIVGMAMAGSGDGVRCTAREIALMRHFVLFLSPSPIARPGARHRPDRRFPAHASAPPSVARAATSACRGATRCRKPGIGPDGASAAVSASAVTRKGTPISIDFSPGSAV